MRIVYLAKWFIGARFFGKKKPLQTVLFVNNQCNLSCKHCAVYEHKNPIIKPYGQIKEELEYSYRLGSRFVDFEGGEPTIWHDNDLNINDLIECARKIGFYSCTITTNAQRPFAGIKADTVWVSLDGLGGYHDDIRGEGAFARLEENVASCGHAAVSVNMTINTHNYPNVSEVIKYVKESPYIKSVSFSFHTPYKGTESLMLDKVRRNETIDLIIKMKEDGYPIMNSVSGLKLMKTNDFRKECWVTNFILPDGSRLPECTGKLAGVCGDCGFGMAGEMRSVFDFKLDTLFAGMRLRM